LGKFHLNGTSKKLLYHACVIAGLIHNPLPQRIQQGDAETSSA